MGHWETRVLLLTVDVLSTAHLSLGGSCQSRAIFLSHRSSLCPQTVVGETLLGIRAADGVYLSIIVTNY